MLLCCFFLQLPGLDQLLQAWALMFLCLLHWTMCSLMWSLGWTIALSIKPTPERPLGEVVISSSFTFIAVYHKHALKDASPVSYIQLIKHHPQKKTGTACNKFARLLSFLIIFLWCFGCVCVWGGSMQSVCVCVCAGIYNMGLSGVLACMHALNQYNEIIVSACATGLSKPLRNRESNLVGC